MPVISLPPPVPVNSFSSSFASAPSFRSFMIAQSRCAPVGDCSNVCIDQSEAPSTVVT